MSEDKIQVTGAKENNLKNISIHIPRNKITVITGLSGSGKSTLAFDTIYAEGQRRYVESLSSYAKNYLEQLKKPEVESIVGLSPAIAIDQKSVGYNPRSTVGTVTEVYDYLRLLYARIGQPQCPTHKIPVTHFTIQKIISEIQKLKEGTKFYILAPMAQGKKGEFLKEFQKWAKLGFLKARVDGQVIELLQAKKLQKTKAHNIDLIVDQLVIKKEIDSRLKESVNRALVEAGGNVVIETLDKKRFHYSIHSACPKCGYSFPELEPRFFSFNNQRGACETCKGLGTLDYVESEELSDDEGAKVHKAVKYEMRKAIVSKKTEDSDDEDFLDESAISISVCPDCQGTRLKSQVLSVLVDNKNIFEATGLSLQELKDWLDQLNLDEKNQLISKKIIEQIQFRLGFLNRVGVDYLSLNRESRTLSGGETQRIRLASQLGSSLIGVLYVLDEPSIGLHPRDHARLLKLISELRDAGNTIILVEHDEDTIRFADHLIDIGPGAGKLGGQLIFQGSLKEILKDKNSITGQYLSKTKFVEIPKRRRPQNQGWIEVKGASGNNLKNVHLKIPLGNFVCVTGVSGSGKSTLIIETLYRALSKKFYRSSVQPASYQKLIGDDKIDKVIEIDQRPIGRTSRSTPATYVGLFPLIRDLFASLPESKLRGYTPGRFSFNVKSGRCEHCQGHGQVKMEMHFLADVYVPCDVCLTKRYNRETLNIKYNSKSIFDILQMTVVEAHEFFKNHPHIFKKLDALKKVGLDYITLGQSATTLSGGEAQRVKLAKELSRRDTGKTFYILDEPTTGLHFDDVKKLILMLQELVDHGNTVLVIEHNTDFMKVSDWVIDIGPEGGNKGGFIVAQGTPETVSKSKDSVTAEFILRSLRDN